MKVWKYVLVALICLFAISQMIDGFILINDPENIGRTLNLGDISANWELQRMVVVYGRLLTFLASLSILGAFLVLKDSPFGVIFALTIGINMMLTAVMLTEMMDSTNYLRTDFVRGALILVVSGIYYFKYYKRKQ